MILTKKAHEMLTTEKKPRDIYTAYRKIAEYINEMYNINLHNYDGGPDQYNKIPPETYAANITITSSGNEPKLYARVYDNHENEIIYLRILDASPAAYSEIASAAGAFLETFNLYVFYNDL